MLQGSRTVHDLRRDPPVLVHGIVTGRDRAEGAVKLRGVARELVVAGRVRRSCDAIVGPPEAMPGG